jgi:biopolymer transport protein ExbD
MKKNKYESLSLDLTPLIDVVFILLIFFILSSSFKKDKFILNLELPDSSSMQKVVNKKQISLELNEKYLAYMGKRTTIAELKNILKEIQNTKQAIMIHIDKKVPYKKVIEVLDILQKNNLHNIAFVTEKNQ